MQCNKSLHIWFGKNKTTLDIILNGEKISWSQSVRHLSHVLTRDLSEAADIWDKLSCFYDQTNYFKAKFKYVTPDYLPNFQILLFFFLRV